MTISRQPNNVPGLYLYQVSVTPGERQIEVDLQSPEVYVDISNCDPQAPENRCNTLPSLHFIAEEPLPNEMIINIQAISAPRPSTAKVMNAPSPCRPQVSQVLR